MNTFAPAGETNPIKPNLVRHSLGEGGFKRGTYTALRSVVLTEDKY